MKLTIRAGLMFLILLFPGCSSKETGESPSQSAAPAPQAAEPAGSSSAVGTQERFRAALREKNPGFSGEVGIREEGGDIVAVGINDKAIKDISPLTGLKLRLLDLSECSITDISVVEGMKLEAIALESTGVKDISPLRGMPLSQVYLAHTPVFDLSPLGDSPIEELNLLGTKVTNLKPLARIKELRMLWLNDTPVSDISPLAGIPLVSLTLAGTRVINLSPLADSGLQRLHIARTRVSDLRPLKNLALTRLVFSPSRIQKGIEEVKNMASLSELGTSFGEPGSQDNLMPPSAFWSLYDAGQIKE